MTGLNHAATGVLVAVIVKQPAIALPAAFLSHFVADSVPHFDHKDLMPYPKVYKAIVVADAFLCAVLLLVFALILKQPAWIIVLAGFLGIAPDIMWLPAIVQGKRVKFKTGSVLGRIRQFHKVIQWSESPKGAYVELLWFVVILILIIKLGR